MSPESSRLISELIRAVRVLEGLGCLPATDGNFSVRNDNVIHITRSGIEKRSLSESGIMEIPLNGECPPGVSSEWQMHRQIYVDRPRISCVLHAHAPYLTAFAAAGKIPSVNLLHETQTVVGEIVLVPFFLSGSRELAEAALQSSQTASVYLLANHGVVAVGENVIQALHRMERAEFLARTQILSAILGGGKPLGE